MVDRLWDAWALQVGDTANFAEPGDAVTSEPEKHPAVSQTTRVSSSPRRGARIFAMGPIPFRRRSHVSADDVLTQARRQEPTYLEVGSALTGSLPCGYRHIRESVVLGSGDAVFAKARDALRDWAAHRFVGASITPENAPIEQGTTLVVAIARGPVVMVAPCRIVAVVNAANDFGFAYGTLPGHPEIGEESFMVRRDGTGRVTFEIVAFSRPGNLFVRAGGPISRWIQHRSTLGYLEGVRRYVERDQSRR